MSEFEFKGTPGTWCQSNGSSKIIKRDYSSIGSDAGELIASAMGHNNSAFYASEAEAEANARAIAAVPELIEALDDLRTSCNALGLQSKLDQELHNAIYALAKATGQEHNNDH